MIIFEYIGLGVLVGILITLGRLLGDGLCWLVKRAFRAVAK